MRKLIYQSLVTLDGYVGGPKDELDWHIIDLVMHAVFEETRRRIGRRREHASACSKAGRIHPASYGTMP